MAVSAIELRPRGAVALFDAAIRLVARTGGVWAATLPGGALLAIAALNLVVRIQEGERLFTAAVGFTAAWFFRGLCQVAACHQVHELLLSEEPASVWRSFRLALSRAPRAFVTTTLLTVLNVVVLMFSAGVLTLFFGTPLAAFAVAAQGEGRPARVLGTAGRLLGPSRDTARRVRPLLLVFPLLALNLHIAANALLMVGSRLLGLQLTFAERFASLDNPTWDVALAAIAFALFEPVRAALGTLLLVDGRVRREGLDLLAKVAQLPSRGSRSTAAIAAALLCVGPLAPAHATPKEALGSTRQFSARAEDLLHRCELPHLRDHVRTASAALDRADPAERAHALRFLRYVEDGFAADEDCDAVEARLERATRWMGGLAPAEATVQASDRAREILARPEFAARAPRTKDEAKPEAPEEEGWWSRFWRWLEKWVDGLFESGDDRHVDLSARGPRGDALGQALVFVLAGVGLAGLAWLLLRYRREARPETELAEGGEQRALLDDGPREDALSKPPEGWAELADLLASCGEFREAARTLYLAVLARLHRDGAIDYQTTASNWDYLRHFRGPSAQKMPFRELTLRFDFAVYGHFELGADGYGAFRALSQPILAPTAGAALAEAHVG